MKESSYGSLAQTTVDDATSRHAEEIVLKGFTVLPGVISAADLPVWRARVDEVYAGQEAEMGLGFLDSIDEVDVCRAPLLYDFRFIELATLPLVLQVVRRFLGDWFILNLQNAIINRPTRAHHQSSWHRDLPYQNFVISKPLAINALLALDEFTTETGGTQVLPFTHKTESLPSDVYINANRVVAAAPAGSMIMFDAMLFHRAGVNSSTVTRRAINHLYTTPILKQQYDFPRAIGEHTELLPEIARLLGFTSQVPLSDRHWRHARAERLAQRSKTA